MGRRPLSGPRPAQGSRASLAAFCLYDFGNSAFTTIIVTAVYSVYFWKHVAGGGSRADLLWGLAVSTATAVVAIAAPMLGARADRFGTRHRYLAGFTLLSIASTAALASVGHGHIAAGILFFILAQGGYAVGEAFYNAFLPDVAPEKRLGLISGLAWGIGYLGGLLSLWVAAALLGGNAAPGPESEAAYHRLFLAVAVQYLLFTAPAILLLRDRRGPAASEQGALQRLRRTAKEARRFRQVLKFLAAYFLYDNGLSVVIAFTSIYMVGTLGFSMEENLTLLALLQLTSAAGSIAAGYWSDRKSPRAAVLASLTLWIAVIGAMAVCRSRAAFTVLALIGGLGIGSTQACSRALLARLVPVSKRAEMFGLFAFCTKASGSVGPVLFGLLSRWSGDQRLALLSVLFFFGAGFILLALLDEEEGYRVAAGYVDAAPPASP